MPSNSPIHPHGAPFLPPNHLRFSETEVRSRLDLSAPPPGSRNESAPIYDPRRSRIVHFNPRVPSQVPDDRTHNIFLDGSLRVYFDGEKQPTVSTNRDPLGWGHVGFGSFDGAGRFRKVRIWAPDTKRATKPAFK